MTGTLNTNRVWPYLALAAGVVCISWSAIFVRWTDMPGPASAFYRMLISTVLIAPTWFFSRNESRTDGRTIFVIAIGGIFFALDLAFFNTGILRTWLIFRRRPAANFWLGLLLALVGTVAIVWSDLTTHIGFGAGDAMSVAAAVFFAGYLMVTERIRSSIGTLVFLRLAMVSSTIFLWFTSIALGVSLRVPAGHSWLALLGLGLVTQLGGYLALTYALGHLPATITSVSLLTQGPLTAVLAALFLAEKLTAPQIFGGLLILAGVGLANRRAHPEEEANALLVRGDA
jgi:drug/metabolite transporter (DMT)-like permease